MSKHPSKADSEARKMKRSLDGLNLKMGTQAAYEAAATKKEDGLELDVVLCREGDLVDAPWESHIEWEDGKVELVATDKHLPSAVAKAAWLACQGEVQP